MRARPSFGTPVASLAAAVMGLLALIACDDPQRCDGGTCSQDSRDAGPQGGAGGGSGGSAGSGGAGGGDGGLGGAPPCSPTSPRGACLLGQVCLDGGCCDTGQICSGTCCGENSICLSDGAGGTRCHRKCAKSADCPIAEPCCAVLITSSTLAPIIEYGACKASGTNCRCSSASECTLDPIRYACTPQFKNFNDGTTNVAGPYICNPVTGRIGEGCNATFAPCVSGTICAVDSRGNRFCSTTCSSDAACRNANTACCNVSDGTSQACGLCGAP